MSVTETIVTPGVKCIAQVGWLEFASAMRCHQTLLISIVSNLCKAQFFQDDSGDDLSDLMSSNGQDESGGRCLWLTGDDIANIDEYGSVAFVQLGHGSIDVKCNTRSKGDVMWKRIADATDSAPHAVVDADILTIGPGLDWNYDAQFKCFAADRPDWKPATLAIKVTNYQVDMYNISETSEQIMQFNCTVELRRDQILWATNATWTHDGKLFQREKIVRENITFSGSLAQYLIINRLSSDSAGIYKCERSVNIGIHIRYFVLLDQFEHNGTPVFLCNVICFTICALFVVVYATTDKICKWCNK